MDARRQTKSDRFVDRPPGPQLFDRRRFERFERRLRIAMTDTSVLPIEEAFILIRRLAADVPIATLAPSSCTREDRYLSSTVWAVCLASHFGSPPVPVSLVDASKNFDGSLEKLRIGCRPDADAAKIPRDSITVTPWRVTRARATVTQVSNHASRQR